MKVSMVNGLRMVIILLLAESQGDGEYHMAKNREHVCFLPGLSPLLIKPPGRAGGLA
jgi:hypothetical protein